MSNIKNIFERLGLLESSENEKLDVFDDLNDDVDDQDNEVLSEFLQAKEDALEKDDTLAINDDLQSNQNDEDSDKIEDENSLDALFMGTDDDAQPSSTTGDELELANSYDPFDVSELLSLKEGDEVLEPSEMAYSTLEDDIKDVADVEASDEAIFNIINEIEQSDASLNPESLNNHETLQINSDIDNLNEEKIEESVIDLDSNETKPEGMDGFEEELLDFSEFENDLVEHAEHDQTINEFIEEEQISAVTDNPLPIDQDTNSMSAKEITMLEEQSKHEEDNFTLNNSDLLSSFISENSEESNEIKDVTQTDTSIDSLDTTDEAITELNTVNSSLAAADETNVFASPSIDAQIDTNFENVEEKLDRMIESYERNKLMTVDDIYKKALLNKDIKLTVFMVEVFAKALPENLPLDVKRESVINIMHASNIKVGDMLSDAYKRIDALNKVLESVVDTTESLKEKNSRSILDLEKRILDLKRTTKEREDFQEEQNTMIEYEIQRIINIVDFIKEK